MTVNPAWEKMFTSRPWGKMPDANVIVILAQNFYFAPRSEIKILDLGCGFGANTWYIAKEGYNTYAIDGAPTAIEKTKETLAKIGAVAHLELGDIMKLPYQPNTFDMVVDVASIGCSTENDSRRIYEEVYRVLKPKGFLYTRMFAPGTDERAFAHGIYNRISSEEEAESLIDPYFTVYSWNKNKRTTPEGYDVHEWCITAKRR